MRLFYKQVGQCHIGNKKNIGFISFLEYVKNSYTFGKCIIELAALAVKSTWVGSYIIKIFFDSIFC